LNNMNQTIEPLFAPQVDDMICQAEKTYDIPDSLTTGLVYELFRKLEAIAVCGEDELREIWLTAERGSIDDFGDYEDYLEYGEVENCEEFKEIWLMHYPDDQKWYLLSTTIYQEIYSVFMDGKLVLQVKPETRVQYPYDNSGLVKWLLGKVDVTTGYLKAGSYNEYIDKNLPYSKRFGKILREDYWRIFPEVKEGHLKNIDRDEVARFSALIEKQTEDDPEDRLPEMTAGLFFDVCRLGYEANDYKGIDESTPKELYRAHADGRDEGLLKLDGSSAEAFDRWYHDQTRYGGHPWEVCRGGNSTHISLYVCHDEKGWWFSLEGSSWGRSVETVKFYLALINHKVPVLLRDGLSLAAMLTGMDYIGIVPERIFPRYCSLLFPGDKILDFMNLPQENRAQIEKAATWYPLREVHLCGS